MNTKVVVDELPTQTREIIEIIGVEDTLRLTNIYGGLTLTFTDGAAPELASRGDIIKRLLGPGKAKLFFKHFAGCSVYIPRCTIALKKARDREIRQDSDTLSMPELVMKYNLSERTIWRILKASTD